LGGKKKNKESCGGGRGSTGRGRRKDIEWGKRGEDGIQKGRSGVKVKGNSSKAKNPQTQIKRMEKKKIRKLLEKGMKVSAACFGATVHCDPIGVRGGENDETGFSTSGDCFAETTGGRVDTPFVKKLSGYNDGGGTFAY